MDMTNIAILGTAFSAVSSETGNIQTASEGDSFKGILGEMMSMSAGTSDTVIDSAADVFDPTELSADNVTAEVMSESTETALKYLVGSYLQSAAKYDSGTESTNLFDFLFTSSAGDDNADYTEVWQELFDSLTSTDISQISSFSAELSTALFGGGRDENKASGDVLTELFDTIDLNRMKAQSKVNDEDMTLAALASGVFSAVITFADAVPDNEQTSELDMQLEALIAAADEETVEGLAAELAEAVEAITENAASENEGSSDIVNSDNTQTSEETKPNTDINTAESDESVTFISYAGRNVRTANISEDGESVNEAAESSLPKVELENDDLNEEAVAAENGQPAQTNASALEESTESIEASEETKFMTMEQVIEKLEEQADGFTENKELVIKLTPETLGEITVKIEKAADGAVSITFAAQNRNVNELLSDRSAQLAQALADKGTEVSSINVVEPSQSGQNLAFDMSGQQNAFNFRQQGMGYHHRVGGSSDEDSEDDALTVDGVSQAADTEYVSKEAKLWTRI